MFEMIIETIKPIMITILAGSIIGGCLSMLIVFLYFKYSERRKK